LWLGGESGTPALFDLVCIEQSQEYTGGLLNGIRLRGSFLQLKINLD
jgi:hypothetical protein